MIVINLQLSRNVPQRVLFVAIFPRTQQLIRNKYWQDFSTIYDEKHIFYTFNNRIMGNILYLIAVILIIAWAIGYFGYAAGGLIHILLVIAIIAILLRIIRGAA
jgi:hypothetical protein